jgi:hypothetical protein
MQVSERIGLMSLLNSTAFAFSVLESPGEPPIVFAVASVTLLTATIIVRNAFNANWDAANWDAANWDAANRDAANRDAEKRDKARRPPFRQFAFCRQAASSIKEVNLLIRTIIRIGEDPVVVFEEGVNEFVLEIIR